MKKHTNMPSSDSIESYLSKCRYYHGQGDYSALTPFEQSMAFYEQAWVEMGGLGRDLQTLQLYLDGYTKEGLADFSSDDGVPITLKALLWNRLNHFTDARPEDFKHWYTTKYLKQ